MKRPLDPARARRAGYPRLRAAWRILVGAAPLALATPASADVTIPPSHRDAVRAANAVLVRSKGEKPVAQPIQPNGKAPAEPIAPAGVQVVVQPPTPPPGGRGAKPAPVQKGKTAPAAHPRKPPKDEPALDGVIGRRVAPPVFIAAQPGDEGAIVLHPHGPDEPCLRTRRG